jgi:hypothetical protein
MSRDLIAEVSCWGFYRKEYFPSRCLAMPVTDKLSGIKPGLEGRQSAHEVFLPLLNHEDSCQTQNGRCYFNFFNLARILQRSIDAE